jgi:hypothetical protein
MSSEIEKDFDALQKEISDKVSQAIDLLNAAKELAYTNKMWSAFDENLYPGLRSVVGDFIFIELDNSWDNSGCSF